MSNADKNHEGYQDPATGLMKCGCGRNGPERGRRSDRMKPIIMSTEDVRCIVNGVKTMKRIPISPQPEFSQIHLWNGTFVYNSTNKKWCWKQHVSPDNCDEVDCLLQFAPFKVGDILYAREAWRVGAWDDEGSICVDYKADGFARREWLKISDCDLYEELWQQSSDDAREANATIDEDGSYTWLPGQAPTRWRSPVTMPREAARLFLRVTDVRVEKNQESGAWEWLIEFERIEKGEES